MEIIPGKLPGSTLFFFKGFRYLEDKQCRRVARCSSRKLGCKATLHFTEDLSSIRNVRDLREGIDFIIKKNHTDLPDVDGNIWRALCEHMKEEAKTTNTKLKTIFDSTSLVCPEVSSKHSFSSVRSSLSRSRSKSRPKIANTLDAMGKLLKDNKFLKAHLTSSSNKTALIFSTDILLVGLTESDELFMDGTFSRTALKPDMEQIYTIHYKLKDTYVASMMILTENRDTAMYDAIFRWMINQFPCLQHKKIHIMSDYEKATVKALRKNFLGAQVHGCYFHFVQAIIKRWQAMKLKTPDSFLSLLMNVPLLPPEMFDDAEIIIRKEMQKVKSIDMNVVLFFDYFKDTWLSNPHHVSVFNALSNTNDGPESFHRYSNGVIGEKHPDFWTLLDGIEKIISTEEVNCLRVLSDEKPKRHTPKSTLDRIAYIKMMQANLMNSKISVEDFLKSFPKCFKELLETMKLLLDNDGSLLILNSENTSDPSLLDEVERIKSIDRNKIYLEEIKNSIKIVQECILPSSCNPMLSLRCPITDKSVNLLKKNDKKCPMPNNKTLIKVSADKNESKKLKMNKVEDSTDVNENIWSPSDFKCSSFRNCDTDVQKMDGLTERQRLLPSTVTSSLSTTPAKTLATPSATNPPTIPAKPPTKISAAPSTTIPIMISTVLSATIKAASSVTSPTTSSTAPSAMSSSAPLAKPPTKISAAPSTTIPITITTAPPTTSLAAPSVTIKAVLPATSPTTRSATPSTTISTAPSATIKAASSVTSPITISTAPPTMMLAAPSVTIKAILPTTSPATSSAATLATPTTSSTAPLTTIPAPISAALTDLTNKRKLLVSDNKINSEFPIKKLKTNNGNDRQFIILKKLNSGESFLVPIKILSENNENYELDNSNIIKKKIQKQSPASQPVTSSEDQKQIFKDQINDKRKITDTKNKDDGTNLEYIASLSKQFVTNYKINSWLPKKKKKEKDISYKEKK